MCLERRLSKTPRKVRHNVRVWTKQHKICRRNIYDIKSWWMLVDVAQPFKFWLKSDERDDHLTLSPTCACARILSVTHWILSEAYVHVPSISRREKRNAHYMPQNTFTAKTGDSRDNQNKTDQTRQDCCAVRITSCVSDYFINVIGTQVRRHIATRIVFLYFPAFSCSKSAFSFLFIF